MLLLGVADSGAAGAFAGRTLVWDVLLAFVVGLLAGALLAWLRNALVAAYLRFAWSRLQHHVANDVLDRMS